jgi:hypothetical protein
MNATGLPRFEAVPNYPDSGNVLLGFGGFEGQPRNEAALSTSG